MPTALSSVPRCADIAGRLVLASRLPSRAAPRCLPGAQLPATLCLGAFWAPAVERAGLSLLPTSKNQHNSGSHSSRMTHWQAPTVLAKCRNQDLRDLEV